MKTQSSAAKKWMFLSMLMFVLLPISCSEKDPTLKEIIESASSELRPGDRVSFIRLNNNALVENVTVHKVERDRILIFGDEAEANPYWINLSTAISYQQSSLVGNLSNKDATTSENLQTTTIDKAGSIAEVVQLLSRINIKPPREWHEMGILEKDDWIKRLNNDAPDYLVPASVKVLDVSEFWSLGIDGEFSQLEEIDSTIPFRHLPGKAKVRFRFTNSFAPDVEFKRRSFSPQSRDAIALLKRGDTYQYQMLIRPKFEFDRGDDGMSISLHIESNH